MRTRCAAGERVARLGSVDGDGGDAVGDVEADAVELLGVGHGSSSSYGSRARVAPGAAGALYIPIPL